MRVHKILGLLTKLCLKAVVLKLFSPVDPLTIWPSLRGATTSFLKLDNNYRPSENVNYRWNLRHHVQSVPLLGDQIGNHTEGSFHEI